VGVSGPQILYGARAGELVHIDDAMRGLACDCTCPQCGRALVARKGEILAHFFAHAAEEINCNPTPESLVHAYAKQQVAKFLHLALPGFSVEARYQSHDGEVHHLYWRHLPIYSLEVKSASVESTHFPGVVPDVLFVTNRGFAAVEVFYRHAVPPEKLEKLQELSLSTVEVDLSDLPASISSAGLAAALLQGRRWSWLNNRCKAGEEYTLYQQLVYSKKVLVPETPSQEPVISGSNIPSRLLTDASSSAVHLKAQQLVAELRQLPPQARPPVLRSVGRELRLALHCLQIGLSPRQLPAHLMQSVTRQSVFGMPTILWQTGLFAKFCMVGAPFTAKQAASWIRTVFQGFDGAAHTVETANGFNDYSEATYNFLNHLAVQGLLKRIPGQRPWNFTFAPAASSSAEVRSKLLAFLPALGSKKV
jgi:hypothetical protein